MRAVSVFPLDEFRLALKKVYGAAAPKGPFTALSQATLFFSRNSCTIACCNLNQWCQATIPAQGDEFSLTLYDTQRLLDACAYFSGELHLEYETAEKKPHNCDIPYNQARFSCGGREIHQLVFDSDLYVKRIERARARKPKSFVTYGFQVREDPRRYVYAPSLRCRPDAPLTERLGILRELRAQFALDGGRVEQLTECKLDGRFRPANVRRRYVTADLNRPVVVHLRAA